MYFVDREQIEQRLIYMRSFLLTTAERLTLQTDAIDPAVRRLAWERVLHLAIESVTDIGSLIIDGFIMRDASSYEDIIEILRDEGVFDADLGQSLYKLVKLRRPLVQQYYNLDEQQLAEWLPEISRIMMQFADTIEHYLERELD